MNSRLIVVLTPEPALGIMAKQALGLQVHASPPKKVLLLPSLSMLAQTSHIQGAYVYMYFNRGFFDNSLTCANMPQLELKEIFAPFCS